MPENNEPTTDIGKEVVPVGSDEVWTPLLEAMGDDPYQQIAKATEYLKSIGCYKRGSGDEMWTATCPIARYVKLRTGAKVSVAWVNYRAGSDFYSVPAEISALIHHYDVDRELEVILPS